MQWIKKRYLALPGIAFLGGWKERLATGHFSGPPPKKQLASK